MNTKRLTTMCALLACAVVSVGLAIGAGALPDGSSAATTLAPSNTAPPTISGSATVGHTLKATRGTWTGTDPITYDYRWLGATRTVGVAPASAVRRTTRTR